MMNIWNEIVAILKAPLTEDLDTIHLFVLVGLVIVIAIGWFIILAHIRLAMDEAV